MKKYGSVSDNLPSYKLKELMELNPVPWFINKKERLAGLEIADIAAYAIGRHFKDLFDAKTTTWEYSENLYKIFENKKYTTSGFVIIPNQ